MKKRLLLVMLVCSHFTLLAQEDAWVYLKDKATTIANISSLTDILTAKAIARKNAHNVPIDDRDIPVNPAYISQLKSATGITVMAKSKWFNAVHVRGSETDIKNLPSSFPFIERIDFANKSLNLNKPVKQKTPTKTESTLETFNYGTAANQVEMIHANQLHLSNYTGAGMTVAVMDSGFPGVNTLSAFERLRTVGQVMGTYDFVNKDEDVYNTTHRHGTMVLSTMAGYVENQYVGTAPDASYYLFVTEDDDSENPVEESYWVEAAERADSLGVDVINTSLGYTTTFNNENYNHTTADMDGNTTFITKGANIAFEKGMLLVNSAGNDGNKSWQIVGAPADAAGVFTVGAVTAAGNYATFSSIGSAFQSVHKPDVVAQGEGSYVILENGAIKTRSGTSFSAPIMAGGMVCLWQALPNKTNAEIMQLVRQSASIFNNPTYALGYGIPNLQLALNLTLGIAGDDFNTSVKVFPNPVKEHLFFKMPSNETFLKVMVFDMLGKQVLHHSVDAVTNQLDVSSLSKGLYLLKIHSKNNAATFKIIKQ